jgi:hypothetical protein
VFAVAADLVPELIDALPRRGRRLHDWRLPLVGRVRLQREICRHRLDRAVGAFAIRLVHDEDVGNLHDAGLERLHLVAGAGHERHHRDVGGADDVHFILAHTDGFDDDDVLAGGVEDEGDVARRTCQAAQVAPCRHAPDEHLRIG